MDDKKVTSQNLNRTIDHRGSRAACVMEVIAVETSIGKGTADDPKRIVYEYWSMGGQLLAVYDPETSPF